MIRDPDDAAARKYSTEMICDDVHNLPADIGSGLQWSEEGQEDDPLRVSGVFERPVMLQARERRERVREVWRAKEERGGRGWAV